LVAFYVLAAKLFMSGIRPIKINKGYVLSEPAPTPIPLIYFCTALYPHNVDNSVDKYMDKQNVIEKTVDLLYNSI